MKTAIADDREGHQLGRSPCTHCGLVIDEPAPRRGAAPEVAEARASTTAGGRSSLKRRPSIGLLEERRGQLPRTGAMPPRDNGVA